MIPNGGLFAFGLLGLAILSLWVSDRTVVWGTLLVLSLAVAKLSDVVTWSGFFICLAATASVYGYYRLAGTRAAKISLGGVTALLTLALFGHLFPGFREHVLLSNIVLSPRSYSTSILWNFDKPFVSLLLMGWGIPRIRKASEWKRILPAMLGLYLICAGFLGALSCGLHVLAWAPKWSVVTGFFALTNLLFVCVPEEAFFRGFIPRHLTNAMKQEKRGIMSVMIASAFFGICHFAGGLGLMLLSTVAGLFYGLAYQRTGCIEAAIGVHFLLNLTHFVFFTYPALIQ